MISRMTGKVRADKEGIFNPIGNNEHRVGKELIKKEPNRFCTNPHHINLRLPITALVYTHIYFR